MSKKSRPNISKTEIQQLPSLHFPGIPKIISSESELEQSLEYLNRQTVLGFDTETRPSFKAGEWYPVALLQLSSLEQAYLFRLNLMGLPAPLRQLLSNPDIQKVGLALEQDLKALKQLKHFNPKGFIDLAELARKTGFEQLGLRSLTASLLQKRLTKAAKMTNWERHHLTSKQIRYAATDAWISLKLYNELLKLD